MARRTGETNDPVQRLRGKKSVFGCACVRVCVCVCVSASRVTEGGDLGGRGVGWLLLFFVLAGPRRPPAKIVGASHAACPFRVLQVLCNLTSREEHTATGL